MKACCVPSGFFAVSKQARLWLAGVAKVPVDDIDDVMLGRPFTPPLGRVGSGI